MALETSGASGLGRSRTEAGSSTAKVLEHGVGGRERIPPGRAPGAAVDTSENRIIEAHVELIQKLFLDRSEGSHKCLYRKEGEQIAKAMGCSLAELAQRAIQEIRAQGARLDYDWAGRVASPEKIGSHFEALHKLIDEKVEIFVFHTPTQLGDKRLPLQRRFSRELQTIMDAGGAATLFIVKSPPEEAAIEIRKVTDEHLGGLMSLWSKPEVRGALTLSPALRSYIEFATVRVLTTSGAPQALQAAEQINKALEHEGGFEDRYTQRVIKQISQSEQHESLRGALKVCVPIVVAVKLAEKFMPGAIHAIGGGLDDLFGAVIPNVSQSMGRKDLPFFQRMKGALGVALGGLASVPVSAGLGMWSAHLFENSEHLPTKIAAGAIFAAACCAGTAATSMVAFAQAWRNISKLERSPHLSQAMGALGLWEKTKLAFQNSILDVPFRIGHTCIGVPTQFALGMAAGAFGFFNNGYFVAAEGMLETVFGAAVAFAYPVIAERLHRRRLLTNF